MQDLERLKTDIEVVLAQLFASNKVSVTLNRVHHETNNIQISEILY